MKKSIISVTAAAALYGTIASPTFAATHEVRSGDSLWKIANQYNVTITNIKEWNKLTTDIIYPKQVLKITQEVQSIPTGTSKPNTDAKTYVVKSGDTLGKIAITYSTTVKKLQELNHIDGHLIYPGQKLIITSGTNQPEQKPQSNNNNNNNSDIQKTYTVKPGDSLYKIALDYNTTVHQLKAWNSLSSDLIFPGQTLFVSSNGSSTEVPAPSAPSAPKEPSSGESKEKNNTLHTVEIGDTLSYLAIKYGVTVKELKEWNKVSNIIYLGQKLIVGKENDEKPASNPTDNSYSSVADLALSLVGTPYKWGGNTPEGFDCSGFIYYLFNKEGSSLQRLSSEGYYNRSYYIHTPQKGDLVFFENTYKPGISHMGIYAGDNKFIHAGDNGVEVTSLSNTYWSSKFEGFKRFY
jgi:LysM repeat protein